MADYLFLFRPGEAARMLARCQVTLHTDGRCGLRFTYPWPGLPWRRILPRSIPTERAAEVLAERSAWVLRQLDRVEVLGGIRRPASGGERREVLLGGERVPLRVIEMETHQRYAVVRRDEHGLTVAVPEEGKVDVVAAVKRWLRREARRVIEERVGVWAKVMKRTANRVYIRGQRTKWGNCSRLHNLSFNWWLVMAPFASLDAIVIHELAHLMEPTHETRFWLLVHSHCPDYSQRVRWLADRREEMFAVFRGAKQW